MRTIYNRSRVDGRPDLGLQVVSKRNGYPERRTGWRKDKPGDESIPDARLELEPRHPLRGPVCIRLASCCADPSTGGTAVVQSAIPGDLFGVPDCDRGACGLSVDP